MLPKNVIFATDHAGFELCQHIINYFEINHPEVNLIKTTTNFEPNDDFPQIASIAYKKYIELDDKNCLILGFCGSGNGISIALNRYSEIRAINGYMLKQVKQGKEHLNANCLCLGGVFIEPKKGLELVKIFIQSVYKKIDRYEKRIKMIS